MEFFGILRCAQDDAGTWKSKSGSLRDDNKKVRAKAGTNARATTTAKANAGVLRSAQNDKLFVVCDDVLLVCWTR
jgi:hypothetical protein